ncbi:TPA: hypothetical protein NJ569_003308 [Vibrio parahaemolyticus]|nr:hypothetical protein [Vibrio parahaemolyticus]
MEITTGDFTVLHSGSTRSASDATVKFSFDSIYIKFDFSKSTKEKSDKPSISTRVSDDEAGLIIEESGYKGPFGSGWGRPVHIGVLSGKNLYLSFTSSRISPSLNTFEISYTFYLGEDAETPSEEETVSTDE